MTSVTANQAYFPKRHASEWMSGTANPGQLAAGLFAVAESLKGGKMKW